MTDIAALADRLTAETAKIIYGKNDRIRLIVMAVLAQGHILLEDLPGVGKTTLVKTLSLAAGCESRRIQFVPDLLPADITGMNIYDRNTGNFKRLPGPVFTNMLLADEINRAVPRTQSALLEAMEERQVTIDGETTPLPAPFVVMATQNPVESESTFPLPAAQMDRFLIRLSMGYPSALEERQMLFSLGEGIPFDTVQPVTSPEELIQAQKDLTHVHVSEAVADYLIALVSATRTHPQLRMGASPRASRALFAAARTWAAMAGRDFVIPDDIQDLAEPVLAHRLLLTGQARLEGVTAASVLAQIIKETPVPHGNGEEFYGA
ncbi:MAG: MoxR family ATPase [Lachnospiraceae bacterium]|nr:MoxR family ATPase [Lachnospiraceae bacterium]